MNITTLLLFVSCVSAVTGDMFLVWYAKSATHPKIAFAVGAGIVLMSTFLWTYTMFKGIESATAITCYALFTVMGCSFLGVVVFKESLSVTNAIGMALGLIALVLVSLPAQEFGG